MDCKLKIQGFFQVAIKKNKFSKNPRPGTKNHKIQGIPGFPGDVPTLLIECMGWVKSQLQFNEREKYRTFHTFLHLTALTTYISVFNHPVLLYTQQLLTVILDDVQMQDPPKL